MFRGGGPCGCVGCDHATIARYSVVIVAVLDSALLLTGWGKSDSAPERGVTVVGAGQVRGAPDTLNADLGVEVSADNVSAAIVGAPRR